MSKSINFLAALMLLVSQSLTAQVYVDNYATASDGLPDTEDIRDAIAELDKNGDTLFFGPGFYDIGGPNPNNQFNPALTTSSSTSTITTSSSSKATTPYCWAANGAP